MHNVCFITFVSKVTAMNLPSGLIGKVGDVWITHDHQATVSLHHQSDAQHQNRKWTVRHNARKWNNIKTEETQGRKLQGSQESGDINQTQQRRNTTGVAPQRWGFTCK